MMSKEQVTISELLPSLDSSELQEAEQVRATVNQQLSTGGAVLSSLVDYYLDSTSPQAVLLLSTIREPHHKPLLEKLNESLNRPGTRLAGLTLLGHLIRKQPPWVHHISRSALLPSLLRCLKTDSDVVVLITAVLVLITLLPMIPQTGKQHIYDFFDVFGRLASWSYRNPGHVPVVHLVHLHAGVYSLFHRLYGMFPCNFISYLRLHYSMKENLDTFQEVIKPMLEHVRVHPELVTGTQDHELDPSRWKCYEVHDIVIECSRVSLDPLESSCEEDIYTSLRDPPSSSSGSSPSPRPPPLSFPLPVLDLTCSPHNTESISSAESLVCPSLFGRPTLPQLTFDTCAQVDDVTWSPSSHCGMSTPPPEPAATASTHPLSRTASLSGVKCPSQASVPSTPSSEDNPDRCLAPDSNNQVKLQPLTELERSSIQPVIEREGKGRSDVINNGNEDFRSEESPLPPPSASSQHVLVTSTPNCDVSPSGSLFPPPSSNSLCFTPPNPSSTPTHPFEEGGPDRFPSFHLDLNSAPSYELLFDLALPQAASLFIRKKTQEMLEKAPGQQEKEGGVEGEDREQDQTSVSPLEVLDQLIVHGHDAHECLSRRLSAVNKSVDRHFGGKQQSMKTKGLASGEELQCLKSQLLLIHSQLQFERFKRQQHAIRNRRLLRRVISATALEEHSVAMRAQLCVQDEEIRSLKLSLKEEQRRYTQLQLDAHAQTNQLHKHVQQLLLQQQDAQRDNQRLQSEVQECQTRLKVLEAELQRANNKANNAEHQLTQLSLKLSSSEQLQQQIFLLNQQLVLLRETNRTLTNQIEGGPGDHWTEASMLQCSVGKEYQHLKDSDVQQRQKLEAANHRIAELENQLAKKDQLILDQKKLFEDMKAQSRAELSACDSRCVALRRVTQSLQTEMLHLYSQVHLDMDTDGQPWDIDGRPNGSGVVLPVAQSSLRPRPSSGSLGIINGALEALSTSPLHLPSCSSSPLSLSPIESPLAVGSFLEQRARELFKPTNHSPDEEEEEPHEREEEEEEKEEEEEDDDNEEEAKPEIPPLGQEMEETIIPPRSPQLVPPSKAAATIHPPSKPPAPSSCPALSADLTLAVRQRRHELSIMDYDETQPEY
ncbi:hamartin-like isoform X1 [Solea senegalensis]|uniref:Hamartin-like isoform X1 n=1 Tax=Solea senegalensis TaxID=28829 RepID=A0AAV6QB97_SOLSE|nr:TSC complex subunit 1a isoform X2 [Solea senegalensis]KAG7489053.1 hamartin-like isoform X1 [Solea senegalensis]